MTIIITMVDGQTLQHYLDFCEFYNGVIDIKQYTGTEMTMDFI